MKQNRRQFLIKTAIVGGSLTTTNLGSNLFTKNINYNFKSDKMKLSFKPYTLELKHVFTLATSSRKTTPVILTQIEYDGVTGYGEASMPPYLGESQETASVFLSKVDLSQFHDPFELEDILEYVDGIDEKNTAAKASVDIALHDLVGKLLDKSWHQIWGYNKETTPSTSFTIGIDTDEVVRQKVKEAAQYPILKIKVGKKNDAEIIAAVRSVTDKPLRVDANEGWKSKEEALEKIQWLKSEGVEFIEQPMPSDMLEETAWLRERVEMPIVADEAVKSAADIPKLAQAYDGINIKSKVPKMLGWWSSGQICYPSFHLLPMLIRMKCCLLQGWRSYIKHRTKLLFLTFCSNFFVS